MSDHQFARLIPVSHVGTAREAEMRATSALLAVLHIVRPFSKVLLDPYGAPKAASSKVDTYIETSFKTPNGVARPDGMIIVEQGKKNQWTALVEVKTGEAKLDAEQVNGYYEIARERGYDAVITISNELQPAPGVHPTPGIKVRANSKVAIHHMSWFMIRSLAVIEHDHRKVSDPEQAYILKELIRYLENPQSGAFEFTDMGEDWTAIRDGVRDGAVDKKSPASANIAQKWDQLNRFLALKLSSDTGANVQQILPKPQKDNPTKRSQDLVDLIAAGQPLTGALRIPDTIGDMEIAADLRARRISTSVSFDAPTDRGNKAKLTWLMKQLESSHDSLIVEVWQKGGRAATTTVPLGKSREDTSVLLPPDGKDIARFRLVLNRDMGVGRKASGKGSSFVESVTSIVLDFYDQTISMLKAVVPAPPKAMKPSDTPIIEPKELQAGWPQVPISESPMEES